MNSGICLISHTYSKLGKEKLTTWAIFHLQWLFLYRLQCQLLLLHWADNIKTRFLHFILDFNLVTVQTCKHGGKHNYIKHKAMVIIWFYLPVIVRNRRKNLLANSLSKLMSATVEIMQRSYSYLNCPFWQSNSHLLTKSITNERLNVVMTKDHNRLWSSALCCILAPTHSKRAKVRHAMTRFPFQPTSAERQNKYAACQMFLEAG